MDELRNRNAHGYPHRNTYADIVENSYSKRRTEPDANGYPSRNHHETTMPHPDGETWAGMIPVRE